MKISQSNYYCILERAWCKVCQTAMGASVTKFKDHSNTYIHKKNSYLEEKVKDLVLIVYLLFHMKR